MNFEDNYYIIINMGLRSVRAIIFDHNANNLSHSWYPVESKINSNHVEQDPNEWWYLTRRTIKDVLRDVPEAKKGNIYFSVTSSACCLVAVDRDGEVLHDSLMVSDKRSHEEALELEEKYPEFSELDGMLPVASYLFPKILWKKNNREDVHRRVYKYLSSNDYVMYKLSGKFVTDPLNAQKFYYDKENIHFFEKLLNDYDLKKRMFPTVKKMGTIVGPLLSELKKEFELVNEAKVVLSTYDAICAFWGAGVAEEGDSCNVIGTVSSCRALSNNKVRFSSNLLSQPFPLFDKHIVGGSNNLDGGLVEWAKDSFYGDSYPEKYVYSIMQDEAGMSSLGANGLLFLPYLLGERAPFWDTNVRGMFLGVEKFHSRSDFIRSLYEASGFMLRDMLEDLKKHGVNVKNVRLSGGMSQSDLVCKLRADITGKDIYIMSEKESTALGAAIISMVASGQIKDLKEISRYTGIAKIYTPDKEAHKKYTKLYKLFKKVYRKSSDMNKLRKKVYSEILDQEKKYVLENM